MEVRDKIINILKGDDRKDKSQKEFDEMINYLIKEDMREPMWRLAGAYPKLNHGKVIDYYIKKKDSFYLVEYACYLVEDSDEDYITERLIKIGDKEFIKNVLEEENGSIEFGISNYNLKKLQDFLDS
jgi:hypothetical protein